MTFFLKNRNPNLVEAMDQKDCDVSKLFATYDNFRIVNRLLSKWQKIYRKLIKPHLKKDGVNTILDIGFGGGDICILLAKLARKDGFSIEITACEMDKRAMDYIAFAGIEDQNITFKLVDIKTLLDSKATFDFVISNHLMHHLSDGELQDMMSFAGRLANKRVIFNDIERSDLAIPLFWLATVAFFRNSFITEDGLISIKRSFTRKELSRFCSKGWRAQRMFPFRLLLIYNANQIQT